MKTRRELFASVAAAGAFSALGSPLHPAAAMAAPAPSGPDDRRYWLAQVARLALPVLVNLSQRRLKQVMPVEANTPDRGRYTHLEAFGRLLAGIAPWLAVSGLDAAEQQQQRRLVTLTLESLDAATDPQSPDFMNFNQGGQPLVDAAFLAQAILRAPTVLWQPLSERVRGQVLAALVASRAVPNPTDSNWVMFSASVEAALLELGQPTREERLEGSLRRMLSWYKGDGVYGDGRSFHFDYYNSFVMHPMLVDVLTALARHDARFESLRATIVTRARRYAEVQERCIAPDGSFPVLGRSITYRLGAFQALAQMALQRQLVDVLRPAQVRCALTAVLRRTLEAPGTFDAGGWLRLGLCGSQPALAEGYISTGSLYLCSFGLLPLGLPPADPFWSDPAAPWTSQRAWSGENLPADHALKDEDTGAVPTLAGLRSV